ncbi:hypothetical protein L7F22_039737 [Adiantum nelumboides]|nr:hypothetical protein [Adiantum nelumboides]
MLYRLNTILPIEFLIPTLRVAKQLEWTGHEWSERRDDLEKLGETRLQAVVAIYAQKRRMKEFHDRHVKTKEFQIGDYVLVYTLKQKTKKLKKRGMGPFVIHSISSSGAINLATLDGHEMPNWISGYRLKKYHLPLSQELLEHVHATKERKRTADQNIQKAQEEAKERAAKRKQMLEGYRKNKITRLCQITTIDEDEDCLDPYILTKLGDKRLTLHALVDSGTHLNTISWDVYQRLPEVKVQPKERIFIGFNGTESKSPGFVTLMVYVKGSPCPHNFFVLPLESPANQIILGTPWQRKYEAYIHWAKNQVFVTAENKVRMIDFASLADTMYLLATESPQKAKASTTVAEDESANKEDKVDTTKPRQKRPGKEVLTTPIAQAKPKDNYYLGQQQNNRKWKWIPKQKIEEVGSTSSNKPQEKPLQVSSHKANATTKHYGKTRQVWVRKDTVLLEK